MSVQRGPLQLTLQSQSPANGRVERIISVLHGETKMSRVVIHLQFGGWPRSTLPASPAPLVQFVAEVSVMASSVESGDWGGGEVEVG